MSGRGAAAGVAAMLMLLVGCSDEDPPASLPSSLPSTTSETPPETTTPAPTTPVETGAPTVPAEAQQQTPDGAAAFVQHWFDTLTYSWDGMQSEPILALGECLTCVEFAETIDRVAADGNRLEGNEVNLKNVAPNAVLADGSTSVVTLFDAPEQNEVNAEDEVVDVVESAVTNIQYLFNLTWMNSKWSVTSIRLIQ